MQVQTMQVSQEAAMDALRSYKAHRDVFDRRDWEIERIYRAIAKGKTVISAEDAIVRAGVDERGRPRLAICEAHATHCLCSRNENEVVFGLRAADSWGRKREGTGRVRVPWPGMKWNQGLTALLPRIPPQHRPAGIVLSSYHLLWEANWEEFPVDPYLLRRIGKDAWVVLAAWELTEVEVSVLRAHGKPE